MFVEPRRHNNRTGWIEVVCGSMFSGKTEELMRRLRRAKIAHQKVEIFKPSVDTRYHDSLIVSHDDNHIQSTPIGIAENILLYSSEAEVIGIDEAQFFDENLPDVCAKLAENGSRVIVAGLDMDFKGNPFGPMPRLMAMAEYVTKVHAICVRCGSPAGFSYRLSDEEKTVLLGEKDNYEPRCRHCFNEGISAKLESQEPRINNQD